MTGKVPNLVPTAGYLRIKGVIRRYYDFRRQTWVTRGWPTSNGGDTPARKEAREDFSTAQQLIKRAEPTDYAAAQKLAAGTPFLARDLLMKAAYGTLLTARTSDGQLWIGIRMAFSDIQTLLASLGNTQGMTLYSDGVGWYALPAGEEGQVLTTHGTVEPPSWETPTGGGGGKTQYVATLGSFNDTNNAAFASRGTVLRIRQPITLVEGAVSFTPVSAASYKIGIAKFSESTRKLLEDPIYTDVYTADSALAVSLTLPFANKIPLLTNTTYLLYIVRTDGTPTTTMNIMYSTASQMAPSLYFQVINSALNLASNDPTQSDVWTHANDVYSTLPVYEID